MSTRVSPAAPRARRSTCSTPPCRRRTGPRSRIQTGRSLSAWSRRRRALPERRGARARRRLRLTVTPTVASLRVVGVVHAHAQQHGLGDVLAGRERRARTSTLNVPDGSSASWRAPPPQPAASAARTARASAALIETATLHGPLGSRADAVLPVPDGLARDGIALRRMRGRDAAPWAAAFREDPAWAACRRRRGPDGGGVRRFIARQPRLRARGQYLGLAVTDADRAAVPRPRDAPQLRLAPQRAEVGYWLVPRARGRGAGRARSRCSSTGRSSRSASTAWRSPRRPRTRPPGAGGEPRVRRGGRHGGPQPRARAARGHPDAGPLAPVAATVPV